jgi:type II secretion system protein N
VRRLSRVLLIVFGVIIGSGTIALIGANLYVQSQGTQARIQQELSHRLGTPLRIHRISVTPWGGLKLSGIAIPQISSASPNNFLEAKSFGLRVRFLSLFSRRLVIKEISLVDPTVVWPQNSDGKWRLPGSRGEEEEVPTVRLSSSNTAAASAPATAPTQAPVVPPAKTTMNEPESEKAQSKFVAEIRRLNVTGGNFRFLDRTGNLIATFEGVRFRSGVRSGPALRGSANVAKISLRDRFFLERLQSPLRYDPGELDLSKISARAGSGEISGRFSMQPESENSPFTASVNFRDVQADQIVAEAGGPKGVVQGKLEGKFEATGKTADANALAGTGEISLRDGQVQQYSLLVALGQVLQIEELTQLHLEQAEAKYHISPGLVTIDQLILRSPNIRLSATGTITFNGKLRLESQLAINEKVRAQLFKPIRQNFQPTDERGYSAVDFQVSGTVDRPKSNLMEKIVGRDLKDFVSGFLGGGKSDRPKKKKAVAREEPASPSPSATIEAMTPAATATPSSP